MEYLIDYNSEKTVWELWSKKGHHINFEIVTPGGFKSPEDCFRDIPEIWSKGVDKGVHFHIRVDQPH